MQEDAEFAQHVLANTPRWNGICCSSLFPAVWRTRLVQPLACNRTQLARLLHGPLTENIIVVGSVSFCTRLMFYSVLVFFTLFFFLYFVFYYYQHPCHFDEA